VKFAEVAECLHPTHATSLDLLLSTLEPINGGTDQTRVCKFGLVLYGYEHIRVYLAASRRAVWSNRKRAAGSTAAGDVSASSTARRKAGADAIAAAAERGRPCAVGQAATRAQQKGGANNRRGDRRLAQHRYAGEGTSASGGRRPRSYARPRQPAGVSRHRDTPRLPWTAEQRTTTNKACHPRGRASRPYLRRCRSCCPCT